MGPARKPPQRQQRKQTKESRLIDDQGSPGDRGKGNGLKVSNGNSQSARKNTTIVTAEPIASSRISSRSRSRLMPRAAEHLSASQLSSIPSTHPSTMGNTPSSK